MARKVDGDLILNSKELDKIFVNDLQLEREELAVALAKSKVVELKLRLKLLEGEITKAEAKVQLTNERKGVAVKARHGFLETIQKKHKLPKDWGYNPDNGKIIVD